MFQGARQAPGFDGRAPSNGENMSQARTGLIALALAWAACGFGSVEAQSLSEEQFLTEFPTVLSATRLRQDATQAPQAVTVIDQQMIRASGAREFAELFRMVPGFTVSYVAHLKGLQPIVNYHGLGREYFSRLQVLIDGRSMNNATLGGVDWSEFPLALEDLDRIEVIRGPSSSSHGIGAFAATINFISKYPAQQRGASARANYGNDGVRDATLQFGAGTGTLDYRLTAGYRADDGFDDIPDDRDRRYASARGDLQFGPVDHVMLQAGATDGDSDAGSGIATNPLRSVGVRTWYGQANWERSFSADSGFYLQFYYYRYELIDQYLAPLPADIGGAPRAIDGGSTVDRADLEFQQSFGAGDDLRWIWGASVRSDRAEVPSLFPGTRDLLVQRLFARAEWSPSERILVNAGAMLEDNDLTGTDLAPQLGLNFRATPNHTVRLNLSKALRTPTLIENQSAFNVGPPGTPREGPAGELLPESILSRELSYVGQWPAQHLTLDVKLFDDDIQDLIALVGVRENAASGAFPRNAVNGDDARQRGIEAQLQWRPDTDTLLLASASYLDTDSDDRLDRYSSAAPSNIAHVLASRRFAGVWDASVAVHLQGSYWASGLSDPQDGYTRVDTRLARQLSMGRGNAEVALTVQNLFDEGYTEYRRNVVAGRRAWLTFSYTFAP